MHELVAMVPVSVRQRGREVRGLVTPAVARHFAALESEQARVATEVMETGVAVESAILAPRILGIVTRHALGSLARHVPLAHSPGAMFSGWRMAVGGLILYHSGHRFLVILPPGGQPTFSTVKMQVLAKGTVRVVQSV